MKKTPPPVLVSMTGYGRASVETGRATIDVEVKSLNHRFLDLGLKIPRVYSPFEVDLRSLVGEVIKRGKIEIYVTRRVKAGAQQDAVQLNRPLFDSYLAHYRALLGELCAADAPKSEPSTILPSAILQILARGDVLSSGDDEGTVEEERSSVLAAVKAALSDLVGMRRTEGRKLAEDITRRIAELGALRAKIVAGADNSPQTIKERILARVRRLSPELAFDDARILQEAALQADRVDITEEVVRLESHLEHFLSSLGKESNGKKLDFLTQEIAREFNTIGSKAQDPAVQQSVVLAKVEIEKLREQLQNVE